jgi:rhodanese-related sulfurtransferase
VVAHVPRSVSVASDVLIVRHEELIALRDAPVVLIDDDAVRALLTGVWLRRLGLPRVQDARGRLRGLDARQRTSGQHRGRDAAGLARGERRDAGPGRRRRVALAGRVRAGARAARRHQRVVPARPPARRVWLPRGWLETRIAAVAPSPDEALLLTCIDGAQAAFAAATLRQRGYVHVAWLQGGTRIWAAAGRALETSALPPQDDELLPPARRDAQAMRDYLDWERCAIRAQA